MPQQQSSRVPSPLGPPSDVNVGPLTRSLIAKGLEGTGRCEKIDLETWSNFGLKNFRARIPYRRPLGLRYTFRFRRNFSQINFFTSSRRSNHHSSHHAEAGRGGGYFVWSLHAMSLHAREVRRERFTCVAEP
jgi:hypothetical protein